MWIDYDFMLECHSHFGTDATVEMQNIPSRAFSLQGENTMIARKFMTIFTLLVLALTLAVPARLSHAAPMPAAQSSPDFSLSFFNNPQTVKRGSGTLFQIEIQPLNGFTGTVHIQLSASLPPGINCSCAPFDVSVTGTGITFASFSVDVPKPVATAPTGTFNIQVLATSGTLSHSETAILIVR